MPKGKPGKITVICVRCGESKIHRAKGMCDGCWQAARLETLRKEPGYYVEVTKKECFNCHKVKPCNEYAKNRNTRDGLQAWCNQCRHENEKRLREDPEWVARNKERQQKRFSALSEEEKRVYHDKGYEWQKKKMVEDVEYRNRKNFQTNRKNVKRNRLKTQSVSRITYNEWIALCDKYENVCLRCKRNHVELTLDHVIPLSRGGTDTIDNIQPLCRSCNSRKNNKHIDYR